MNVESTENYAGGNGGYDIGSDKSVGEVSNDRYGSPPPADVLYCVNNCFSLKKKKKKELLFTIVGIVLLSDFGVASG